MNNNNNNDLGTGNPFDDPIDDLIPKDPPFPTNPNTRTVQNVNITLRFECPECGGRFASWDTHDITHFESEKRCPFCHVKKGEFGDDKITELQDENEELQEEIDELKEKLETIQNAFD